MTLLDWLVVAPSVPLMVTWRVLDAMDRKVPMAFSVPAGCYVLFAMAWLQLSWWAVAIAALVIIALMVRLEVLHRLRSK